MDGLDIDIPNWGEVIGIEQLVLLMIVLRYKVFQSQLFERDIYNRSSSMENTSNVFSPRIINLQWLFGLV